MSTTTTTGESTSSTSDYEDLSSATQESLLDVISSTVEAIKTSTTLRPRNKTRLMKVTTIAYVTSGDSSTVASVDDYATSESLESSIFSTSEANIVSESAHLTTTGKEATTSTTFEPTVIKAKHHKQNQQIYGNSVNQVMNITTDEFGNSESNKSTLPAECYCEPEFEG
jgi:hypothetical protein